MTDVDPVTLEVVRNATAATAEEMNAALVRTGYSPNIKERRDCSTAVFDADGEMINQAETMPVHLGAMPFSVAAATEAFPREELAPGDAILLNDPFRGGAHLPDLTLVSPVFRDGSVVAFVANRAHHADVGGASAGSVAADTTEIYQEGLRLPPLKLYAGGDRNEDVFAVILANTRTPDERRGDLRAQSAANETGRTRLQDLFDRHGDATTRAAFRALKDYSERRMREEITALPDGTYTFEDVLDDDGHGHTDLPIAATVTIDDDAITVDFDGSADQVPGPVNAVRAVTASATYFAVRAVTDPDIPANHGCYRPITIETPAASIVDADPPAAIVGGNLETSQRVTDVVLGAFADAAPDRVPAAGQGTMNNLTVGGTDPRDGSAYAFYETQAGGFGARPTKDGMDAVHVHMSNTQNTPIEVLETAYPLRVEAYALRPDSAGAGRYRGGLGLRREIRARDHDATVSLLADRHRHAPYGLAEGADGATGAVVHHHDDEATEVPAKTTLTLAAGDVLSLYTPGGGGYGDPADRDPTAIAADLRAGVVSRETVRTVYDRDPDALPDPET